MKWLFLISLITLNSQAQAAATVNTPFQVLINQTQLKDLLKESLSSKAIAGSATLPIENQTITNPFTVTISGISIKLDYSFGLPKVQDNVWVYKTNGLSAELNVVRIDASQIMHVVVGGTTIDIKVDGHCDNVKLALPEGRTNVEATTVVDLSQGAPALNLKDFKANWAPGSWKVVSLNCEGPRGFDKIVAKAAEEQLGKIDPFLGDIRQQIQKEMTSQLLPPIVLPIRMSDFVNVLVTMNKFDLRNADQTLVTGTAKITFAKVKQGTNCSFASANFANLPVWTNEVNALSIPMDGFKSIMKCLHSNGDLKFNFDSSEIQAFSDLMHSGFQKWLVWPDLGRFAENSLFKFEMETVDAPTFENERASSREKHAILFDIDLPLRLNMLAPEDGGFSSYLHIYSDLLGPARWTIKDNTMNLQFAEGIPLKIESRWDQEYLRQHQDVNQNIWWSQLEGALKTLLTESGLTIDLPKIPVSPNAELGVKSGNLVNDNIQFEISYDKTKTLP